MSVIYRWAVRAALAPWAALVVLVGWWAADREPPFAVIEPGHVTPVAAGGVAQFSAQVRRDLDRDCSAVVSRYIVDAAGWRHDLAGGGQRMSAAALRALAEQMGADRWRLSIELPRSVSPGPAVLSNELDYTCNPVHGPWPIRVSFSIVFEVLP